MSQCWPVALLQFKVSSQPQINRQQVRHWLEQAMAPSGESSSPRLLMLPEVWNSPYQAERFAEFAEPIPPLGADLLDGPSASLRVVADFAANHGVSVIAGSIAECTAEGRIFNTATVISPQGRLLAKHRKIHLFDVDLPDGNTYRESATVRAGSQLPPVASLPGLCSIGLSICYDVRFPEVYRHLAAEGADLLTVPAAFTAYTGKDHWQVLLQARAIENTAYVLAPAQTGLHYGRRQSHGHALVIDPWGTVLADAGVGPGVAIAPVDTEHLRRVRAQMPSLRHRQPTLL